MFVFLLTEILLSCNKNEFLEEKPDTNLQVPSTLLDFRSLLDYDRIMSETPVMGELSSDNYYMFNSYWTGLNVKEKNSYIWKTDVYGGTRGIDDWNKPYEQVFYANVVLDGLNKMTGPDRNSREWNDIMGAAYFIRAYAFHNLAQVFSPLFDPNISIIEDSLGIPLRVEPDITIKSQRATVRTTYDTIVNDLKRALYYLKDNVPIHLNRPTKSAAYALMARVYLSMRKYDEALDYADSCLTLNSALLDYHSATNFSNNPELLYQSKLLSTTQVLKALVLPAVIVDSNLFRLYDINDKRRSLFFNPANPAAPTIRIGYSQSIFMFSGLATDEVYLIKAECLARTGNYTEGVDILNTLLVKRYIDGTFTPLIVSNQQEALDIILTERRKELVFRGLRWTDLKRLNKDGANITLTRMADSNLYTLLPNHPNYLLPIPPEVPIKQNPRD